MHAFNGIYALASLDGAPLEARDAAALALPIPPERGLAVMAARDGGVDVGVAADRAFIGHLDERAALATSLGLDPATLPVDLVQAAIARYGDDAPARLLGEWLFASWDEPSRTLTLMTSDTAREPLLFATDGRRVAVGPHVRVLRRLDGIDATPCARGLLLHMGRAPVRGTIDDETILRGVRRVASGTRVTITRGGVTAGRRRSLPTPSRWQGSFADAIEELDALLRRIVGQQLARHPRAAAMLSGGLDSSLLVAYAAAERSPGSLLVALTSAAPAGSGLPDEIDFSRAVAEQAGIAMVPVVPDADADAYLPSAETLNWLQQPVASPRHYLYEALYRAAELLGVDAILDGVGGEWTVTGYPDDMPWRERLRRAARRATGWARHPTAAAVVQDAFHVRLSQAAIAAAQAELQPALRTPEFAPVVHRRDDVWGYAVAITKNLRELSGTQRPGVRRLLPLRDRRLLILFAGMPYSFLTERGMMRAPARALLAGKIPEHVRLRRQGGPFSPDYRDRIRRQAPAARGRLPDFARAGVGDWLDLAWLDRALAQIGTGDAPPDLVTEAQMTACAAAFLAHWSSASGGG